EDWIKKKLSAENKERATGREKVLSYRVQVVVHVVHNGEVVGQGLNISDAQIMSQLSVLNEDFNRLNADAASTPEEFQPVAGSMNIEFILAQQTPDGLATNGINRVKGTRTTWTMSTDDELKSLSYWDANNYLNIWVCNITDYIAYAQFPISTLPGLENSSTNRLTDGIIISHNVFGSSDYGNFNLDTRFNKGRTLTHEVGHFFGLRHTWGDEDNCEGTDYVHDTPPQSESTTGCPDKPFKQCPANDPRNVMFQNFLDLTHDACMNLFTVGQVNRMRTVLENSPRRASLLLPFNPLNESHLADKLFSPNGDGVNDYWKWYDYNTYQGCKLTIFNRFGKSVFNMTSYDGSWDGRSSDGQVLEEEGYYYVLSCDGKNDITGGVRIIR
ncbi:MAG: hypothetical protein C0490_23305, partial [Marivirga sp.]|nr:hypothetical protein [Marivirga sp.]